MKKPLIFTTILTLILFNSLSITSFFKYWFMLVLINVLSLIKRKIQQKYYNIWKNFKNFWVWKKLEIS